MSQQVNLILPELRPRFDWLALPVVLSAALVGVLVLAVVGGLANQRADRLAVQDAQLKSQLQSLQQQSKELAVALAARQGDATLPERIETMRLAVAQRREAMKAIGLGNASSDTGSFAESMRGFSRQVVDGVWLTEFTLSGKGIEIYGRLTEPSLLPRYIRRLNGEAAFAGRRFEALEMKGEMPQAEPAVAGAGTEPAAGANRPLRPFTGFVLRSDATALLSKERAR